MKASNREYEFAVLFLAPTTRRSGVFLSHVLAARALAYSYRHLRFSGIPGTHNTQDANRIDGSRAYSSVFREVESH